MDKARAELRGPSIPTMRGIAAALLLSAILWAILAGLALLLVASL